MIYIILLISLVAIALNFIPRCVLFKKMNISWWKALVPFYGDILLFKCSSLSPWLFLLEFVPIANVVITIIMWVKLANNFKLDIGYKLGLIFLNIIFIWIIAFSKKITYSGPVVNNKISYNAFLNFTIIFFILLTSIVGLPNLMFVLVPLFITILLELGYNKITTFASTIGAILVGQIGTTFSFSIWGYLTYIFGVGMFDLLFVRVVFLIMITMLYLILIKKKLNFENSKENKYDLLKVLIITFLIITLLSWIIPSGYYYNSVYYSLDVNPIGIYDLFRTPVITPVTFIQYGILFLAIGGFYGILDKCGVYSKFTSNIVENIGVSKKISIDKNKTKKSVVPFVVIGIITFILLIIGLYNWYYAFDIKIFSTLYEKIVEFEIDGYPIFKNLLGSVSEIGFFNNYDLSVILIIAGIIIGLVYKLKINDIIEGISEGFKNMFKPALYSMLASIIFASLLIISNNTNGDFIYTIINQFISENENFSFLGTVFSSIIASFAYNDFPTLASNLSSIFGLYDTNILPIVAFIIQAIYSLVMIIAPTSLYLLAGLSLLDIKYKDWVKYIWKYVLIIFGILIIISFMILTLV